MSVIEADHCSEDLYLNGEAFGADFEIKPLMV